MNYVPFVVPDNVDARAWKRAKEKLANHPQHIASLVQLERVKNLILSGDPTGELT